MTGCSYQSMACGCQHNALRGCFQLTRTQHLRHKVSLKPYRPCGMTVNCQRKQQAVASDNAPVSTETYSEESHDDVKSSHDTPPKTKQATFLETWLQSQGMPEPQVKIKAMYRANQNIDITVAAQDLHAGDTVLRIPEHLIITLKGVFEDEAMAELLTTDKLSELACVTLYMMYEKMNGKKSRWHHYIKELDRQRGRGQMGAKSPLLWEEGQVESLLAGSPVVNMVKDRLKGIEKEYQELDTVWFMAGSLFRNYPYDIPTEAFSLQLFTQAFATVQASIVHLQDVTLSKRFALVPLGPPLLSYSSTSKAMLKYDSSSREVRLTVDRDYKEGEPVFAWCGPQPNSRLLLNYGIVDEQNPNDKMTITATIPNNDPLFPQKRYLLQQHNMSSQQSFQLQRHHDLPPNLLPYLRLGHCTSSDELKQHGAFSQNSAALPPHQEAQVLQNLASCLQQRLQRYRTSQEEDDAVVVDPRAGPREKVAARLLRIEKSILSGALAKVANLPGGTEAVQATCQKGQRSIFPVKLV